jgi:hypothetical protein
MDASCSAMICLWKHNLTQKGRHPPLIFLSRTQVILDRFHMAGLKPVWYERIRIMVGNGCAVGAPYLLAVR